MYKYIFTGVIYPERVKFILKGLSSKYKELTIGSPDWGIEGSFDMEADNSKVLVNFKSNKIFNEKSKPNIETLKNVIEKTARIFIDTYCFVHSYNYDLTIDSVECAEIGLSHMFSVIGEFGFTGNNDNFTKWLDILLQKQPNAFGDAFADYRRAIKYPDMTAAYCLRAIESIRRVHFDDLTIKNDHERDKNGWINMSKKINVQPDDSYKLILKFATPNRHGVYPIITWNERKGIMQFTRKVIEKSLEWVSEN